MLDKKYNHLDVEKERYNFWLKNEFFKSGDRKKEPFCIVIPPPNVTGKLHIGHAWDTSIQDIIIRYKRMDGFDTLWIPGMDHAGIATQSKVDAKLKDMNINPREITKEEWLKYAWDWKDEYADNIKDQWGKLGLSLDYSKERFTLDEGLSDAVKKVFIDLYNQGLIYRGERIINWDPKAMTALSNEEVIYKEIEGAFYHLKYNIEDSDDYLEVATTRPETLFGDTAVCVNPNDDRYKHLIGKNVVLPILNKLIPIIADDYAEIDFGTGVVKITPAHDPFDFEVGNRHNLERVKIMNKNGTLNELTGKYNGLDRFEARNKLVEELKEKNLLIKIKKMVHSVGHSERSDEIVEPYLSKQWFVKMRPLADKVLETQKNSEEKVNFVPKRYEKIMNHWMTITYDWCISRQLWWGHQIPAWYKGDETYVGENKPDGDGWIQDNDVLDTWFSSALWPFSTLGWPNNTDMLERYYPNNVLVTGYDIIPFWVNRMTFQGLQFTKKSPFKDCLIHGLIRDKQGRKMSKSLGNGVDPMEVIEKYGADSLRFFLTTSSSLGQDLRYDEEKVASTWNFINKLWNASRFALINLEDFEEVKLENLTMPDKWILTKLNITIKNIRKNMEKYEFNIVGSTLYQFIWEDFCDWYIEMSKNNMTVVTKNVLLKVLTSILKMLHPFMPYVTEEIYLKLPIHDESITVSEYPKYNKKEIFNSYETFEKLKDFIVKVRNIKAEKNIPSDALVSVKGLYKDIVVTGLKVKTQYLNNELENSAINYKEIINNETIEILFSFEEKNTINIEKVNVDIEKLNNSIERRNKLLNNSNYVAKAPISVVENEKEMLKKELNQLEELKLIIQNV